MRLYFAAFLALAACTPKVQTNPLPQSLTDAFGCPRSVIEREWAEHRYQGLMSGDLACAALGRFGTPTSSQSMSSPVSTSATLMWNHDGSLYSANLVKYTDYGTAQRSGRAPGIWYVDYFLVTQLR